MTNLSQYNQSKVTISSLEEIPLICGILESSNSQISVLLVYKIPNLPISLFKALKENKSLVELNLSYNNISATGAKALAEALKVNASIVALGLSWNNISDTGSKHLAEVLKVNKSLVKLYLGSNSISDTGVQSLAEALKVNKSLVTLYLKNNSISDTGAHYLAETLKVNKTLVVLNLNSNKISDTGSKHLAEVLKVNKSLVTLDLNSNCISYTGAQYLAEALRVNKSLRTLNLDDNSISDTGAQYLAEALRVNKSLVRLNLDDNSISDTGAQSLAEALRVNKSLVKLYLGSNSISATGVQYLSEALKVNKSLVRLGLWGNSISDTGAQSISEALTETYSLTSKHINQKLTSIPFEKINKSTTSLDLSHNLLEILPPETPQRLQNLKILNLSHNQFKTLPKPVFHLPLLETLDISYNPLLSTFFPEENSNSMNQTSSASTSQPSITQILLPISPPSYVTSFFSKLHHLNISHTKITKIPQFLLVQNQLFVNIENLSLTHPPLISHLYANITFNKNLTAEFVWKDIQRIFVPSNLPTKSYQFGKIILIGDPAAGKTEFYRHLLPENSIPNENLEHSTVVFNPPLLKHNIRKERLCVYYDFAGQFRYMPSHSLFFSNTGFIMYFVDLRNLQPEFLDTAVQHAIRWFLNLQPSPSASNTYQIPVFFVFSHLDCIIDSVFENPQNITKYEDVYNPFNRPQCISNFLDSLNEYFSQPKYQRFASLFDITDKKAHNFGIYGIFSSIEQQSLFSFFDISSGNLAKSFQLFLDPNINKDNFTEHFVQFADDFSNMSIKESAFTSLSVLFSKFKSTFYPPQPRSVSLFDTLSQSIVNSPSANADDFSNLSIKESTLKFKSASSHQQSTSTPIAYPPPLSSDFLPKARSYAMGNIDNPPSSKFYNQPLEPSDDENISPPEIFVPQPLPIPDSKKSSETLQKIFETHIRPYNKLGLIWINTDKNNIPDISNLKQTVCISVSIMAKIIFFLKNRKYNSEFPPIFSEDLFIQTFQKLLQIPESTDNDCVKLVEDWINLKTTLRSNIHADLNKITNSFNQSLYLFLKKRNKSGFKTSLANWFQNWHDLQVEHTIWSPILK